MIVKIPSQQSILIVSLSLIVAFLAITPSLAQSPPTEPLTPAFVPGEIIVKFQPNVSKVGAQNFLRAEGLRPLEVAPNAELLRVQVAPGHETEVIAELEARGDVVYATYNYQIQALGPPTDTYYGAQWALNQPQDHDIDAPEGWDLNTGSNNVIVAIIDTGVDLDHPDLVAKITSGSQAGYNYISPGFPPNDDNGHGTHVAGIAAASTNNGKGIAGVSWGAKIMPLKILNATGNGSTYNLSLAIRYAADHGARVINMSLGGGCGSGWPDVEDAVNYALSQGVVLVAASGNNYSTPVLCPGAINGVMAVGATDSNDNRASYSTYGSALAVAAPGSGIYSTLIDSNPAGLGTYGYKDGTSMSAPHVAGLAALIWSFAPSLNNTQIRNTIETTTDDLGTAGWDQYYGSGRINVRRALERVSLQISPAQPSLFIDDNPGSASSYIQITTPSNETITWSATISSTDSWLTIAPPASGVVAATSSDQFITLNATIPDPGNYDSYTATLVMTGTVSSTGVEIGPIINQVRLEYLHQIQEYYMPFIFKD